jgi:hypothetical protein
MSASTLRKTEIRANDAAGYVSLFAEQLPNSGGLVAGNVRATTLQAPRMIDEGPPCSLVHTHTVGNIQTYLLPVADSTVKENPKTFCDQDGNVALKVLTVVCIFDVCRRTRVTTHYAMIHKIEGFERFKLDYMNLQLKPCAEYTLFRAANFSK